MSHPGNNSSRRLCGKIGKKNFQSSKARGENTWPFHPFDPPTLRDFTVRYTRAAKGEEVISNAITPLFNPPINREARQRR